MDNENESAKKAFSAKIIFFYVAHGYRFLSI